MEKITFNFRIDRATRNKFKKIAEANGTNATTLLTRWINDYLASNSQDNTDSKDVTDKSAKTNVSVDHQTTNIEQIANAQTEELNKLWGAIYQQQKEIKKLNAKMQRRKDEVERKVDHADLLNYFYGWSVPVNQETSLTDRINQLENKSLTNAELEGVQCLLPNAIAPNTASNFPTGVAEDCPDHNTSSEETVEHFEVNQHEHQEENPKQKMQEDLTESLTTTEIARQHNMSRRTLYKYSQGKKVGDRWNYAGKTYEIVHIDKKGEKKHKLVQNVD